MARVKVRVKRFEVRFKVKVRVERFEGEDGEEVWMWDARGVAGQAQAGGVAIGHP